MKRRAFLLRAAISSGLLGLQSATTQASFIEANDPGHRGLGLTDEELRSRWGSPLYTNLLGQTTYQALGNTYQVPDIEEQERHSAIYMTLGAPIHIDDELVGIALGHMVPLDAELIETVYFKGGFFESYFWSDWLADRFSDLVNWNEKTDAGRLGEFTIRLYMNREDEILRKAWTFTSRDYDARYRDW